MEGIQWHSSLGCQVSPPWAPGCPVLDTRPRGAQARGDGGSEHQRSARRMERSPPLSLGLLVSFSPDWGMKGKEKKKDYTVQHIDCLMDPSDS